MNFFATYPLKSSDYNEETHARAMEGLCRYILIYHTRITFLEQVGHGYQRDLLQFSLVNLGHVRDIDALGNYSLREKFQIKLIQMTQPAQCGYESVHEELLSCNNTIHLGDETTELYYSLHQRFNKSRPTEDKLYRIKGSDKVHVDTVKGLYIYPLSLSRDLLMQGIRAYEETGTSEYTIKGTKQNKTRNMFLEMGKRYEKLEDQPVIPIKMSFGTNIYYTFMVLIYCMMLACISFAIELRRKFIDGTTWLFTFVVMPLSNWIITKIGTLLKYIFWYKNK